MRYKVGDWVQIKSKEQLLALTYEQILEFYPNPSFYKKIMDNSTIKLWDSEDSWANYIGKKICITQVKEMGEKIVYISKNNNNYEIVWSELEIVSPIDLMLKELGI